jgi:hypothetical protein
VDYLQVGASDAPSLFGGQRTETRKEPEGSRPVAGRLTWLAEEVDGPQPVTGADVGDTESVVMIRCSGDSGDVTIRSRWQDQGGRPVIAHAEPAE